MTVNFSLIKQAEKEYKNNQGSRSYNQQQSFKGVGDFVTNALIASDKSPMIGVSIIDLLSMIGPRTIVDATRNGFAATETFLRESAGLIINCLIPSFVVFGMGKLVEKSVMGKEFSNVEASKIWANQKSNEFLTNAWLSTKGATNSEERVGAYVKNVLDRVEGLATEFNESEKPKNVWRKISDLSNKDVLYKDFEKAILNNDKKLLEKTTDSLIKELGASRNIKLVDTTPYVLVDGIKQLDIDGNIKNLTRDMSDMGRAFTKLADDVVPTFSKKLTKLINTKSLSGLAVIVAAGASFQYFNRMLTKYRTGHDGFVGESDYLEQLKQGKKIDKKEFCEKERRKLNFHKLMATLGMGALAVASFGKMPTMNMFQFNGLFPTMNQCRAISAVTYSGRIITSANDNELKETALRDTCTFINLYYLGDYVSKAFATLKEKFNPQLKGQLLNRLQELPENATGMQKFWNWFRHTELKGFEELTNNPIVKKNRAYAQSAGLLYSCLVLGLLVPIYNKYRTNKNGLLKQQVAQENLNIVKNIANVEQMDQKKLFTAFIRNN